MMPAEDGLSLCRYIRESTDVPVIMLTAMAEETDRIVGLELAEDDYLSKPFNPRELLARLKTVLQAIGSLQRRVRSCMAGVRAKPFAYGAPELIAPELYLNQRAAGMPLEVPGVKP